MKTDKMEKQDFDNTFTKLRQNNNGQSTHARLLPYFYKTWTEIMTDQTEKQDFYNTATALVPRLNNGSFAFMASPWEYLKQ